MLLGNLLVVGVGVGALGNPADFTVSLGSVGKPCFARFAANLDHVIGYFNCTTVTKCRISAQCNARRSRLIKMLALTQGSAKPQHQIIDASPCFRGYSWHFCLWRLWRVTATAWAITRQRLRQRFRQRRSAAVPLAA